MELMNGLKTIFDFLELAGPTITIVLLVMWYENKRFAKMQQTEQARFSELKQIVHNQEKLINSYEHIAKNFQNLLYESRDVHFMTITNVSEIKEKILQMRDYLKDIKRNLPK